MKKSSSKVWFIILLVIGIAVFGVFYLFNDFLVDEVDTYEFLNYACVEVKEVEDDNGDIVKTIFYNPEIKIGTEFFVKWTSKEIKTSIKA